MSDWLDSMLEMDYEDRTHLNDEDCEFCPICEGDEDE